MKYSLPNIVSLSRVALAPVFVLLFMTESATARLLSVLVYIVAALTDYFDGWLARRYHDVSNLGIFLDPLADKVLVLAALAAFAFMDYVPLWMLVIIVVRDVAVTGLRAYADSVNQPVITSRAAKVKTFLQMMFIAYVLVMVALQSSFRGGEFAELAHQCLNDDVLYGGMLAITVVTVWTGIEYVRDNRNLIARLLGGKIR